MSEDVADAPAPPDPVVSREERRRALLDIPVPERAAHGREERRLAFERSAISVRLAPLRPPPVPAPLPVPGVESEPVAEAAPEPTATVTQAAPAPAPTPAPPAATVPATLPAPAPVPALPGPDRPSPRRAWRPGGTAVAAIVLLGLVATGVGLAYAGARIVHRSTQGKVLSPVDDPTEPGFEANVDPTPTLVLLHSREGAIDGITLLSLPDQAAGGGALVFVPTRTIGDLPLFGEKPIEYSYDLGSPEAERQVVQDLVRTGIGELAVVDARRWADLVEPVAPLPLHNPDRLRITGADGDEVVLPTGAIELEADQVGPYLEARVDEDETDLARLHRHQLFWQAWLSAIAADGSPAAVPGETASGLGRFVRVLAAGEVEAATLPVDPVDADVVDDDGGEAFEIDERAAAALLDRVVPFPTSPRPGVRPRVRVLNGTADTTRAAAAAVGLPVLGIEVVTLGNALEFGVAETTIRYASDELRAVAQRIRRQLGVGEVALDPHPGEVADITVTLGADYERSAG